MNNLEKDQILSTEAQNEPQEVVPKSLSPRKPWPKKQPPLRSLPPNWS